MVAGTICSRDSSTRMGSPTTAGVAAASTKSQRGVMTAVPKELSLGLTRWTRKRTNLSPYKCGWPHSNCGDAVMRVNDRKRRLQGEDAALKLRYGELNPKSTMRV